MNNYSFLDSTGQPTMPRPPPSPSPSQAGSQVNGGQQNGIPMVNGLPSGGQQTDMNHLWAVVQQLSQLLEENKAQTAGIVNGVAAIQGRAAEEGGAVGGMGMREVNGELNGMSLFLLTNTATYRKWRTRKMDTGRTKRDTVSQHVQLTHLPAATTAHQISTLQTQLSTAQQQISALTASNSSLSALLTDYESALTLLLDKLRPYAYSQTTSILALHKHYQALLDTERSTSMGLRLEHAEWQAGLSRVAENARNALKTQGEVEDGLRREIKEVKEENRVLRRLVGWEEKEGSDDEQEEKVQ